MNVSIVIPTYNNSMKLVRLLECITSMKDRRVIQVNVCDDGSTDDTFEVISAFKVRLPITYSYQKDNGFRAAAARNLGIRKAIGDVVIFLDDDVLLCEDFIDYHLAEHKMYGPGTICFGYRFRCTENLSGLISESEVNKFEADHRVDDVGVTGEMLQNSAIPWYYVYSCNFSVSFMSDKMYFDERFVGWGNEDLEYAYRLWKSGYRICCSSNAFVLHIDTDTPRDPFLCRRLGLFPDFTDFIRNSELFRSKYPNDPLLVQRIDDDLDDIRNSNMSHD